MAVLTGRSTKISALPAQAAIFDPLNIKHTYQDHGIHVPRSYFRSHFIKKPFYTINMVSSRFSYTITIVTSNAYKFFHNTELSLYQLSSPSIPKDLSLLERGFVVSDPSILSLFRSSYLPAKHHQRCKVWHRHQPIENIRYRPDGFHPADAAEKDRNKITP